MKTICRYCYLAITTHTLASLLVYEQLLASAYSSLNIFMGIRPPSFRVKILLFNNTQNSNNQFFVGAKLLFTFSFSIITKSKLHC